MGGGRGNPRPSQKLGAQDVVILAVQEGSPAHLASLKPSTVLRQLGRRNVQNVADYEAELNSFSLFSGVLLLVLDGNGSGFVLLKTQLSDNRPSSSFESTQNDSFNEQHSLLEAFLCERAHVEMIAAIQ